MKIDKNVIIDEKAMMVLNGELPTVFTRNCMFRMVCGKLGSVASRMALDDQQACAIDGARKGAGIVRSQGVITHIQYYFTMQTWIEEWFKKRGLTAKGWMPGEDPNEAVNDTSTLDFGEDEEEIEIVKEQTNIEFGRGANKEIRTVDKTRDQHFEEV